jgi:hypothetical protein
VLEVETFWTYNQTPSNRVCFNVQKMPPYQKNTIIGDPGKGEGDFFLIILIHQKPGVAIDTPPLVDDAFRRFSTPPPVNGAFPRQRQGVGYLEAACRNWLY